MENLIKRAAKTIFFKKETGDVNESLSAFTKLEIFYGETNMGRLVIPHIGESIDHSCRVSTLKLNEYCDTIKKMVGSPEVIAETLNKKTANKDAISHTYHKIIQEEKGKHALELFLEYFISLSKKAVTDKLLQSQFVQSEIQQVIDNIESFCYEVVFIQTPKDDGFFLIEIFPVFKNCCSDEYFGSRVIISVPVVFNPHNIQGLSTAAKNFLLAKTIFFGERLEELAENSDLSSIEIDKIIIEEWSETKKPWFIKKEKWVLNFFNQLAVNYLTATGVQNIMVSIGEKAPHVNGDGELVFFN